MNDDVMHPQSLADPAHPVSQAAREFAVHAADQVREGATDAHEKAQQATAAMESMATGAVAEMAKISREAQTAVFDDMKAAFQVFAQIARAKSPADAAQIQIEYFSERSRVNVERMKSAVDYVTSKVGDRYAKWTAGVSKAA